MSTVAIRNKVLLGKEKTAKYWPPEKPVACLDPKISWPTFLVCRHETIGGTKTACYMFLPMGTTLSQVPWQICKDICKDVAELALRHIYVVKVYPFCKTPKGGYVRYKISITRAFPYSRVTLYIDWGFSVETHWKKLCLAIDGIRDHLERR